MSSGLEKSFVRLIRAVIDSYMEGFETAFPAVVLKVNGDGTVNITATDRGPACALAGNICGHREI